MFQLFLSTIFASITRTLVPRYMQTHKSNININFIFYAITILIYTFFTGSD